MRKFDDGLTDGMHAGTGIFVHRPSDAMPASNGVNDFECVDMQAFNYMSGVVKGGVSNKYHASYRRNQSAVLSSFVPDSPKHMKELWSFGGYVSSFGCGRDKTCMPTTELVSVTSTGVIPVANVFSTNPRDGEHLFYLVHDHPLNVAEKLVHPSGRVEGQFGGGATVVRLSAFSSSTFAVPPNLFNGDFYDPATQHFNSTLRDYEQDALVNTRLAKLAPYARVIEFNEVGEMCVRDESVEGLQYLAAGLPQVVVEAAEVGEVYPAGVVQDSRAVRPIDSSSLASRWVDRTAANSDLGKLLVMI